ncbi:UNVERIFIED_CONTAM: putative xyloglucan endotransglucosylase/hydrolase protein 26 [Sesamum radiatum]|uniref:Xyloglucan endotransglucosylase/hydrolase protein 26 n=1 Tax=Sesamum radiatum TaxID=300843 RepID=A0AAW2NMR4_SESRA
MANIHGLCLLVFFVSLRSSLVEANIFNSMLLQWGAQHSITTGDDATLVLDQITGSGIESKESFLFGSFEMQIKLVPGNSAGTVTAYYREPDLCSRLKSISEAKLIWWYVDSIPIRVFRNYLRDGIPYPNKQAMRVYSSIWNADSWATRGGQDKIDWTKAPFIARLRRFTPRACKYNGPVSIRQCSAATPGNWWNSPAHSKLSRVQQRKMDAVRTST